MVPIAVDSAVGHVATSGLSLPIGWIILCLSPSKILRVNFMPWPFRGWWECPSSQELDLQLGKQRHSNLSDTCLVFL